MAIDPLDRDGEPTILKPTPGGRRPAAAVSPAHAVDGVDGIGATLGRSGVSEGSDRAPSTGSAAGLSLGAPPVSWGGPPPPELGLNPVCAAATPMLNLGRQLRGSTAQGDVEALRRRVVDEMRRFERDLLAAGTPPDLARAAHYAVCATMDDLALNTPWGAYSAWSRQGLVSTFHVDVTGGERFFDLLNFMHKDPGTNRDVLALMYLCLSIGFEGRLRVVPQGALELSRIRESLFSTLRQVYGDFERELSPHWRGEDARHRPLRNSATLWLTAALCSLLLLGAYFGLNTSLARQSDGVQASIAAAPPRGEITVAVRRPAPRPTVAKTTLDAMNAALGPELASGRITIIPADTTLTVRINSAGLFASGSADLTRTVRPAIEHLGAALAQTGGHVKVVGHTDNVPYHEPRYRSNQGLSEARAKAVADTLAQSIPRDRTETEGRADTQPVASNDTPQGREQNRRIDVEVTQLPVAAEAVDQ